MADGKSTQLTEEVIRKKLMSFNNTQDSVQGLSLWIMHNKAHHQKIVDIWLKVLRKCEVKHKLTLFYLCNDVVQHAKKKKALYYLENFRDNLRDAIKVVREYNFIKPNIGRIFNIWEERKIYDVKFINELKLVLNGESSFSRGSSASGTLAMSPPVMYTPSEKTSERLSQKDKPIDKPVSKTEEEKEMVEDIESDVLGEFKMSTFLENISTLKQQEVEIMQKAKQLASLQIDATNIEAVKLLKDRSQGQEFYCQFDESCEKIEDYFSILEKEKKQRENVLLLCKEAELFYDEQFKEANIVATAYKNFGTRVTNMKKRVDDMKKIIPTTPSPVPSPNVDEPSPGNSPAILEMDNIGMVDMDLGTDGLEAFRGQDATSKTASRSNKETIDAFQDSDVLDSRIANLFPSLAKGFSSIVSQGPPPPASGAVSISSTLAPPTGPPPGPASDPALSTFENQGEEPVEPDIGWKMYDPSMADTFLVDDNSSSTPVQDEQDNVQEKEIVSSPSLQTSLTISPPRQILLLWKSSPPHIASPIQKSSPSRKVSSPRKFSPLHRALLPQKFSPPRKASPPQKISPMRRASPPQKATETKVKTNPIDFLSQLLTKTNNSSSSSNFLQTLSLLTNTVKSQYQKRQEMGEVPKQEVRVSEGSLAGVPPLPQASQTVLWSIWNLENDPSRPPLQQQHPDPSASPTMQWSKAGPFPPRPCLPELICPMPLLSGDFSIPPPACPPTISQSFVNSPSVPPPPPIINQFSLPISSTIFPQISNPQTLPSPSAASVSVSPATLGLRHPGTVYNPSFPFGLLSPSVSESMMAPPHHPIPQIQDSSPVISPVFFPGNINNWKTLRTENQQALHSQAPSRFHVVSLPPPPDSVAPSPWPLDPPLNHPNRFVIDRYGDNPHSEGWEPTNQNSHSTGWEPVNPNYEKNSWKRKNFKSRSPGYSHSWNQPQGYQDKVEDNDYEEQQPVLPSPMKSILRNNRTSSLREVTLVDESETSGLNQNYADHSQNVGGDHRPIGIHKKTPTDVKPVNSMIDVHLGFVEKLEQNSGAVTLALPTGRQPPMGRPTLTTGPTLDTPVSEPKQSSHNPNIERVEVISTIGVLGVNGFSAKSEEMETDINNGIF